MLYNLGTCSTFSPAAGHKPHLTEFCTKEGKESHSWGHPFLCLYLQGKNDLGGCVQLLCKHSPCLDSARLHSGCMAPWCSLRELKKTIFNFWGAAKCNRPFEGGLGRWMKTIWIFFVTHSSFFKASRKSFWNARGRIRMAIKGGGGYLQHYALGTIHPC